MPWEADEPDRTPRDPPEPAPPGDDGRAHRLEARRFYAAAPAYRIQFETDGTVSLCRKHYEYWDHLAPEEATAWRPISRHADLEEAERRLRHVCGPMVYYDERGRVAQAPRAVRPDWTMPPDDDA